MSRIPSPGFVPPWLNPSPIPGAPVGDRILGVTPFDIISERIVVTRVNRNRSMRDGYEGCIPHGPEATAQDRRRASLELERRLLRERTRG